jgi:hypothetical protein
MADGEHQPYLAPRLRTLWRSGHPNLHALGVSEGTLSRK